MKTLVIIFGTLCAMGIVSLVLCRRRDEVDNEAGVQIGQEDQQ